MQLATLVASDVGRGGALGASKSAKASRHLSLQRSVSGADRGRDKITVEIAAAEPWYEGTDSCCIGCVPRVTRR